MAGLTALNEYTKNFKSKILIRIGKLDRTHQYARRVLRSCLKLNVVYKHAGRVINENLAAH